MKNSFVAVLGITFGATLGLAAITGAVYWWVEVRQPLPPDVAVEFDGFYSHENGSKWGARVILTNNETHDFRLSKSGVVDSRTYFSSPCC